MFMDDVLVPVAYDGLARLFGEMEVAAASPLTEW